MPTSHASIATDRPARYAKQLVSHLTRRATGEWNDAEGRGWLDFGGGRAALIAKGAALDIDVEGDDVERVENVVGRHLVRFGAKDELVVEWTRGDGTAGTTYRKTEDDPDRDPAGS